MSRLPAILLRVPAGGPRHRAILTICDWSVAAVVGRSGLIAAADKREGDGATPIGVFPLRYGFYQPHALPEISTASAFPFVPMSDGMIWEENGPNYNRLVMDESGIRRGDWLNRPRKDGLFDLVVPIGWNDSKPCPGMGSAIFLHACYPDMAPTAGCVGVPRESLPLLAARLRPGMVIDIAPMEPSPDQESDLRLQRTPPEVGSGVSL